MSPRNWRFRIQDILSAVKAIQNYTDGMTYQKFEDDPKTIDAVIRQLMIIGEAASHIPDEKAVLASGIEWRQIRGMRNIIIHEYFHVSKKIIWDTVQGDLPEIVGPLEQLLASLDD